MIPFVLHRPKAATIPAVFVAAHSGRDYPSALLQASRLDPRSLRKSEDSFVDELFEATPAHGAPLLAARFPRAWCDVNREQWELDPTMFAEPLPDYVNAHSPRVQAGLGTIARVVASGEAIYRGKLTFADAAQRIATCWEPFHAALTALIAQTMDRFGVCLLIDCHSMPRAPRPGARSPDVVLGDAFGASCAPAVIAGLERACQHLGYLVARNDPYAGGYITRHYGAPKQGVHAVQVELARDLYMDERSIEKAPGFPVLQHNAAHLVEIVAAEAALWMGQGRKRLRQA